MVWHIWWVHQHVSIILHRPEPLVQRNSCRRPDYGSPKFQSLTIPAVSSFRPSCCIWYISSMYRMYTNIFRITWPEMLERERERVGGTGRSARRWLKTSRGYEYLLHVLYIVDYGIACIFWNTMMIPVFYCENVPPSQNHTWFSYCPVAYPILQYTFWISFKYFGSSDLIRSSKCKLKYRKINDYIQIRHSTTIFIAIHTDLAHSEDTYDGFFWTEGSYFVRKMNEEGV